MELPRGTHSSIVRSAAQTGTILVREWQGRTHRVTMLDESRPENRTMTSGALLSARKGPAGRHTQLLVSVENLRVADEAVPRIAGALYRRQGVIAERRVGGAAHDFIKPHDPLACAIRFQLR